jgi:hypothetical protein
MEDNPRSVLYESRTRLGTGIGGFSDEVVHIWRRPGNDDLVAVGEVESPELSQDAVIAAHGHRTIGSLKKDTSHFDWAVAWIFDRVELVAAIDARHLGSGRQLPNWQLLVHQREATKRCGHPFRPRRETT